MKTREKQRPDKAKKSPAEHRRIKPRSLTNRARITNKMGLLPSVDGRSVWARRWHDLIYAHTADLGGEDRCSEAEMALVKRASCLIVELEHMEMKFALAEDGASESQLKTYQMTVNTLRRTLESLGLKRRAKDVTPEPLEYARDYARRKSADIEESEEVGA